ncbi:endonuclease/exonuclease/phosphatase family protein [Diaphorobacter nitroreducens]|uniref:endonuclease/exonuclease/phosphatase family protein n=1 Tax=Diaphorobacter nitroreducens TaxID=164759 RepID=UPI0028977E61|nr:endonuclease/exonuclease/phosphatase family protein [Diaphorobacter nitroreducens]
MQLVTWNTQWCRGLDGRVEPARIVQYALALGDVDVLCLQEIAVNYPGLAGAPGDQVAQVQSALPAGWQVFFGAAVDEWTAAGRQRFGNLIATRLPVLQLQHHPLPYPPDAGVRSMPRLCSVLTVQDPALGPVRVMTTHLEYYSKTQRMAQALALRALHLQACAQAAQPPQGLADGSPFQPKAHTPHAVLCGDFNLQAHEPEYAALAAALADEEGATMGQAGQPPLWDAWRLLHPGAPQPPTFCVFDQTYAPQPLACDFIWVSDSLRSRVRAVRVDGVTQASDHQPVLLVLE